MASQAIDSLYEVVPAAFVKARNALVKSLQGAGKRDQAEQAAELSRPTASVWASNQVARRAPELVAQLMAVTGRLQAGATRDRERFAAAINQHRELLNQVRERVESALADGGLRVAPATVAAAVQNFRTGLMDERARPLLQHGRLTDDVGLGVAAGLFGGAALLGGDEVGQGAPQARPSEPAPSRPAVHAHPPRATAQERHQAQAEAKQREHERRQQERALAKTRADAERRVHLLRTAASAASATRDKREAAAASARRDLETAERALAIAQGAERQAAAALAAAESELKRLPPPP